LALQGAQRQTVIPAKLVLSQTTLFKFKYSSTNRLMVKRKRRFSL
jgi:hypothetical protein